MTVERPSRLYDPSVRTRVTALIAAISGLALVAMSAAFVLNDQKSTLYTKQVTAGVLTQAVENTLRGPVAFQDAVSTRRVLENLAAEPTALHATVFTTDGVALGSWSREGPAPLTLAEAQRQDRSELVVSRPVGADGTEIGTLVVSYSTSDVSHKTTGFLRLAAGVFLGVMAVSFVIANALAGRLVAPLRTLAAVARRVQEGKDYAVRVGFGGNDEIGQLGQAFDAMLAAIQQRDVELQAHRDGLERLVGERTADLDRRNAAMRRVMDHVDQGFLTLDLQARISDERSRAFDDWFGRPAPGVTLAGHLAGTDERFAEMFALGWEALADGWMPMELTLDQLPKRLTLEGREFVFAYTPLCVDGALQDVLVVSTDVTARVAAEAAQAAQVEIAAVISAIQRDSGGFLAFVQEGDALVAALALGRTPSTRRVVHTLKGNCGLFGLTALASRFHALEDQLDDDSERADEALQTTALAWRAFAERARQLLGGPAPALALSEDELSKLRSAIDDGEAGSRLLTRLDELGRPRVSASLHRLGTQAVALGRRLGKLVEYEVRADGLRLPEGPLQPVWSAIVHLVRNAVDHGIELPQERAAHGKPEAGRVELQASLDSDTLEITIADDGRGVDWVAVAAAAVKRGIPVDTPAQLLAALWADGVTTRAAATDVSGRGVGTAAVQAAVDSVGGRIDVVSELGRGTTFTIRVPIVA